MMVNRFLARRERMPYAFLDTVIHSAIAIQGSNFQLLLLQLPTLLLKFLPLQIRLSDITSNVATRVALPSLLEAREKRLDLRFDKRRWVLAVFTRYNSLLTETLATLFVDEGGGRLVEVGDSLARGSANREWTRCTLALRIGTRVRDVGAGYT
jgi:hypothetical protein